MEPNLAKYYELAYKLDCKAEEIAAKCSGRFAVITCPRAENENDVAPFCKLYPRGLNMDTFLEDRGFVRQENLNPVHKLGAFITALEAAAVARKLTREEVVFYGQQMADLYANANTELISRQNH